MWYNQDLYNKIVEEDSIFTLRKFAKLTFKLDTGEQESTKTYAVKFTENWNTNSNINILFPWEQDESFERFLGQDVIAEITYVKCHAGPGGAYTISGKQDSAPFLTTKYSGIISKINRIKLLGDHARLDITISVCKLEIDTCGFQNL